MIKSKGEVAFSRFTSRVLSLLRCIVLQGLGQLLIGAPRLMLLADKHGVVGAALAKGAGDEVLVQALR